MSAKGIDRYLVKPGSKLDLSSVDSSEKTLWEELTKNDHEETCATFRTELQQLQKVLYAQQKHRVLVIMQAMDTGGKDGCIKHVFNLIDPQGITVHSFKKPSEEDLAHDFLWRVHPYVPRNGQMVIFNRSHYEDVLAVRVKKLLPDEVWKRRYRHIVEFERMLVEEGTTLIKIYLHISKEEQKKRLESRIADPTKHWKLNPEDFQDRARWGDFMEAYEDLIERTSTEQAPWYVIPADRKWYRNLCVANLMVEKLRDLKMNFPEPPWNPADLKVAD